jgi:hypothetical protein
MIYKAELQCMARRYTRKWGQLVADSLILLRLEKYPFVSIVKETECASRQGISFFVPG